MTRAALLLVVAKLAASVTDAHGYHFRVPAAAIDAITDASITDVVFGDEQRTAAVLVVFAARESGFQLAPRGSNDAGHACGPWQHWGAGEECLRLRRDWAYAAKVALTDMRRSALANPAHPLAAYAGSATSPMAIRISDVRIAEAARLLAAATADGGGT